MASDFTRAAQTATIISERLQIPVEYSPFLGEIRRPTIARGRLMDDPEISALMKELKERLNDANWHHSDEENFFDVKERAQQALRLILAQPEERILVVTHGFILRMLIAVMAFGEALEGKEFAKLRLFLTTTNAGITVVEVKDETYTLVTWNDHAHLGEEMNEYQK